MLLKINKNKWVAIRMVAVVLALIPLIFVTIKMLQTREDSIVLFENTSSIISIPIIAFYFLLYISIAFFGIYWIIKQVKKILTLKNEKEKTELSHLQNQVNPHFFFNMLNNLYGLVAKDHQKAQELILKLSDMMRYSIYDGQKETVHVSEEIRYMQNYIELHKMRYHKSIEIVFKHEIKDKDYKILPLLFIILLENAFKHGVENLRENAYVYINLTSEKNQVHFDIENNFDASLDKEQQGIGLHNLKRRLELVYPKKHTLSFSNSNAIYKAQLTIKKI